LTLLFFKKNSSLKQQTKVKYLLALTALFIFSFFYYINYNFNYNAQINKSDLDQTLEYISKNTTNNQEIFTGNPTFALRAERGLALNISHPLVYVTNPPFFSDYDPYNLVPSEFEIIEYLESKKIDIIVADRRTRSLFISERHINISTYIKTHYYVDATFGDIEIYRLLDS
jgi:hypothetical protein